MPIAAIVLRDLLRWARNPGRAAFLLALPLVLAAVFAAAFGTGGDALRVRVMLEDRDDTPLSHALAGILVQAGDDSPLEVERVGPEGRARIERGAASALVVIPEGFTDAFLRGKPIALEVVKNPAERYLPRAVEELARTAAAILSQLSRVFRPELEALREALAAPSGPEPAWIGEFAAAITSKLESVAGLVIPPAIQLEVVTGAAGEAAVEGGPRGVLALVLPGLSVLSLLFFAQAGVRDVLEERRAGLVTRLLTAPVGMGQYLAAKCVAIALVSATGLGVVLIAGAFAGVRWGSPAAMVVLIGAAAIAASGLLLSVAGLAGTQRGAEAVSTIVVMVSSMVGGSFVPIPALPEFLLPLSRLTINYWTARGLMELHGSGGGFAAIANEAGVLAAMGMVLVVLGSRLQARRLRAGGR